MEKGMEETTAWTLITVLVFSGKWGAITLVTMDSTWQWVATWLHDDGHSSMKSPQPYATVADAMLAVELHARERGLSGTWGMLGGLSRIHLVKRRSFAQTIMKLPDGPWMVNIVHSIDWTCRQDLISSLLAHHEHEQLRVFDDWSEAMAFADGWDPAAGFQSLCSCTEGH